MQFAIDLPNYGPYSSPQLLIELACQAEAAGWDGFFVWDHLVRREDKSLPLADPWIVLAAAAAKTERIRLGPMVTPLARRRPWKVAKETTTLDHLSGGRVVLGVGLGAHSEAEFAAFGDEGSAKNRAAMLEEGLEVINGLYSGQPFTHQGQHYHLQGVQFRPRPVQSPRIPIWVAGTWPNKRPFQRAARWDGVFPLKAGGSYLEMLTPAEVQEIISYIKSQRPADDAPFDVLHAGLTPGHYPPEDAEIVVPYAQAGVTWWVERLNPVRGSLAQMRQRIEQGPPKVLDVLHH